MRYNITEVLVSDRKQLALQHIFGLFWSREPTKIHIAAISLPCGDKFFLFWRKVFAKIMSQYSSRCYGQVLRQKFSRNLRAGSSVDGCQSIHRIAWKVGKEKVRNKACAYSGEHSPGFKRQPPHQVHFSSICFFELVNNVHRKRRFVVKHDVIRQTKPFYWNYVRLRANVKLRNHFYGSICLQ